MKRASVSSIRAAAKAASTTTSRAGGDPHGWEQPELALGLAAALTPCEKAARTRRLKRLLELVDEFAAVGCCQASVPVRYLLELRAAGWLR